MKRIKRIVSLIALTAFLFNTAISDLAFSQTINYSNNFDKLAVPSRLDDINGRQTGQMAKLEFALQNYLLEAAAGQKSLNKDTLRETVRNEKTVFDPVKMGFTFSFENTPGVIGDRICVKCKIKDGVQLETYYAVISLKYNDALRGFPTYMYTAQYVEKNYQNDLVKLLNELPGRKPRQDAAIKRYVQHEEGIDTVIRYAHSNGLAKEPLRERFDYREEVLDILERFNVKIANPDNLIPVEDRKFFLIPSTKEIRKMMADLPKARILIAGKEHEVAYAGHSSNNSMHIFVSEENFDSLTRKNYRGEDEITFARLDVKSEVGHEIGAICNAENLKIYRGNSIFDFLWNALDVRIDDHLGSKKIPDDPLELTIADLDTNLETRDYAVGEVKLAQEPDMASLNDLQIISRILEKDVIDMIYKAGSGHPGGSLSMLKMVTALYFGTTSNGKRIMRYDSKDPNWANRDRFVLSKGHAAPGLYAALGRAGFFPVSAFDTLRKLGSILQGHSDMTKTPGVDMSAGSIGVAISAAVGMALAAKMDNRDYTTYVMLGDGEVQEGQVDEAARHAAAMGLDNIVAFLDWNGMQIDGKVTDVDVDYEGQVRLWEARGWNVIRADGDDIANVVSAISTAKATKNGKPVIIIAKTRKGAGLPGMDKHGAAPKEADVAAATEIINKNLSEIAGPGLNFGAHFEKVLEKIALTGKEKDGVDRKNKEAQDARRLEVSNVIQSEKAQAIINEVRSPYPAGKKVSTRTAVGDELVLLGAEDPDMVVMSADLKGSVMFDKFEKAFGTFSAKNPIGRYIPMGIREAHMVSFAAGLATCSKIPVIGTFSIFTTRMVDQLNAVLNTKLPIIIVGTHGGLATGPDARTHQDAHSQGVLGALPRLKEYEGIDAEEARDVGRNIYSMAKKDGGIHYIRPARLDTPIITKPEGWQEGAKKGFYALYDSEAGKPGTSGKYDVGIISMGVVGADAVEAAGELVAKGIKVRVINVTQPNEISNEEKAKEFAALIGRCENLVSVIDALPEILSDKINRVIVQEHLSPKTMKPLGIKEFGEAGKPAELYAKHGFDRAGIVKAALEAINISATPVPQDTQVASWLNGILADWVELSDLQNPVVVNMERYRRIMPEFAYEAANNPNPEFKKAIQDLILKTGPQMGVNLSSINKLYDNKEAMEKALGKNFTIPSMNLRCAVFDEAKIALQTAQKLGAGSFQFEIAPTEVLYTGQTHREFSAMVAAAAISAGYTGPVFIKLDHLRMDPKKYAEDKEKEIQRIFYIMKDAISAGFYAIDIDASVLEKNPKEVADPVEQQRENFIVSARLVEMTRAYAREKGIELALGVEVGEVGEAYITEEHIKAFLSNLKDMLGQRSKELGWNIKMPDVLALPTGTPHGGLRDPITGQALDNVNIAFELLKKASAICKGYGMVGPVQHGASKLPIDSFGIFPDIHVAEIHLATAMSDMEINSILPEAARTKFLDEFVNSDAAKKIQEKRISDKKEPFNLEALGQNIERRKLVAKYKKVFWDVPADKRALREELLGELFSKWFNLLGVSGTLEKVCDLYKSGEGKKTAMALQDIQVANQAAKLKKMMTERQKLASHITVSDTEDEMGRVAAENILKDIRETIAERHWAVMLFASAPSQHSTWKHLIVLWRKLPVKEQKYFSDHIIAFQMDEYLGLPENAPQLFGKVLCNKLLEELEIPRENIFHFNDRLAYETAVNLREAIDRGNATEVERLKAMLEREARAHADEWTAKFMKYGGVFNIVVGGIGKLPHLAFNDPPEAKFDDPKTIKVVRLTEISRQQQVDDGEFTKVSNVPTHALTFSLPPILSAHRIHIIVPREFKAESVRRTLDEPISEKNPASGLRLPEVLPNVQFYLESASASKSEVAKMAMTKTVDKNRQQVVSPQAEAATPQSTQAADKVFETRTAEKNVMAVESVASAVKEIMKLVPDAWLDDWLTLAKVAETVKEAGCEQNIISSDGKSVLIFSEKATFGARTDSGYEEGIGALLPNFVKSGVRVAVVATTDKQRALIEELNEGRPEDKRIVYVSSVAEANARIHAARYYYFKVAGEADAGINGVTSITIIVKKIIDAIGRVMNITKPELIQQMHEAARQFAMAA